MILSTSVYTIYFIYIIVNSKSGDVSLFFSYFNFPSSLLFLKTYDYLLNLFGKNYGSATFNNVVVYIAGLLQYGAIGYFLGGFFGQCRN
jgi:hypothetical protein